MRKRDSFQRQRQSSKDKGRIALKSEETVTPSKIHERACKDLRSSDGAQKVRSSHSTRKVRESCSDQKIRMIDSANETAKE